MGEFPWAVVEIEFSAVTIRRLATPCDSFAGSLPLAQHVPIATVTFGAFSALFGFAVGSFLNVVAHRLPHGGLRSLSGRSHCPKCGALIRWYDNVPVLSWLLLGAKCRGCRGAISPRYPAVELFCGILFVAAWWSSVANDPWGNPGYSARLVVTWSVLSALLALSLVDLDLRILPDEITLPMAFGGPVLVALVPGMIASTWSFESLEATIPNDHLRAGLVSAAGALVGAGSVALIRSLGTRAFSSSADYAFAGAPGEPTHLDGFLARQKPRRSKREVRTWVEDGLVRLVRGARAEAVADPSVKLQPGDIVRVNHEVEAMGFGDVKLQGGIGAFVGPEGSLLVLALASLAGAVLGTLNMLRLFLVLRMRAARRSRSQGRPLWSVARAAGGTVPFGPYLAGGAAVLLLARGRVLALVHDLWPGLAAAPR